MTRLAILLTVESFEHFFGEQLGLSADAYVDGYRNDWAWDYCRILRREGIEPILYLPSLRASGVRQAPDGFRVRFVPIGRAYLPWVKLPTLKRTPLGRFVAQLASAATMLPAMRRALGEDRIDALMIQEYWTARFDVFASRLPVPVIGVDQGMRDRREVKWLKRHTLPRAVRVVTQTGAEAAKVRRLGGLPAEIPNAVDASFYTPDGTRERGLVIAVARLHDEQKRLGDLLRALALLPGEWRAEVVGDGPDRALLEALAKELGVGGRVTFSGFLPDKREVRDRLRRCAVFALPSAFEGLPVALLEAMSCGAPVVATRIRATAEVVDDGVNGLLVPVGDPSALAGAIVAADRDSTRLSATARATIEARYSEERVAPALAELVRTAARRKRA